MDWIEGRFNIVTEKIRGLKDKVRGNQLLDLGSDDGKYAEAFVRMGFEVDCVDRDENNLRMLRERNCGISRAYRMTFEELNINRKYDLIWAGEVLEHVENSYKFLQKIKSLMKPVSYLVLTTPNGESFTRFLQELTPGTWKGWNKEHKFLYNLDQLKLDLQSFFEPQNIQLWGFFIIPPLAHCKIFHPLPILNYSDMDYAIWDLITEKARFVYTEKEWQIRFCFTLGAVCKNG